MQFDWLLFDLDETLMEFKTASNQALKASFEHFNLPQNKETVETYHEVNRQVWHEFEDGQISVSVLIATRMERFLNKIAVNDVSPIALNDFYLDELASRSRYYPNTEEMLDDFKAKGYRMAIVTNGLSRVQRYRWKNTSLSNYFEHLFISEEIGQPKPHPHFFEQVHLRIGRPQRHRVLVIGDNPKSDIKGARDFGYRSCWINREGDPFANIKANYEIQDLKELSAILQESK